MYELDDWVDTSSAVVRPLRPVRWTEDAGANLPAPPTPYNLPHAAAEIAVLQTLAYADVFDFPLDRDEIFRYCVAPGGSRHVINAAIIRLLARGGLQQRGRFLFLPGREETVAVRRRLSGPSKRAWRSARRWGRVLWALPYVRMVAVTGSLAVDGKTSRGDIDLMIAVQPGRLWLTRALCLLVWRLASLTGVRLCPNYLVSTDALAVQRHDLYTARELVQMVPLHGRVVAAQLWASNRWSRDYLPNAQVDSTLASDALSLPAGIFKRWTERLLAHSFADRLERWERERKIDQMRASAGPGSESEFTADTCKDHAHGHGARVMTLYTQRLAELRPGERDGWTKRGKPERDHAAYIIDASG